MAYGNGGSYGETSGVSGATYQPAGPQAARVPMVEAEIKRLGAGTEALHNALNELEARISSALMPESPTNAKEAGVPVSPVVLAHAIGSQADRVSAACARIGALISRLEL